MNLNIKNTFNIELPADPIQENYVRQVSEACFSNVVPTSCKNPTLIHVSDEMLAALGISTIDTKSEDFLQYFSGNKIYPNTKPYAICYGGHQFGSWAGQLGDGRAINLFEVNHNNIQWAVQLKGAGKTPYSRSADGLAVLRSSVREYLCSEAMHHLGVPTTRALSLILSGNEVLRDMLYDGNADYEKGAIVCRVAPSFIRFGNFQILAARKELTLLKQLTDYTIQHFYAHLGKPNKEVYLKFIQEVAERTMQMVIHWERVGFVHGVMNTDNMSILGLTIDYGPYGWLEDYDPIWTPNTTDSSQRRYRFGTQYSVALWNLYQLANALFPLVDDGKALEEMLEKIQKNYHQKHHEMMLQKIGLATFNEETEKLIEELKSILQSSEMDMTLFFRNLSQFDGTEIETFVNNLKLFSYATDFDMHIPHWTNWFSNYAKQLTKNSLPDKIEKMNATNPKYVLRNYMSQLAIDAANKGDYSIIEELYQLLKKPYDEQPSMEKWFAKRPDWAKHKVGCSMLSCSS